MQCCVDIVNELMGCVVGMCEEIWKYLFIYLFLVEYAVGSVLPLSPSFTLIVLFTTLLFL